MSAYEFVDVPPAETRRGRKSSWGAVFADLAQASGKWACIGQFPKATADNLSAGRAGGEEWAGRYESAQRVTNHDGVRAERGKVWVYVRVTS